MFDALHECAHTCTQGFLILDHSLWVKYSSSVTPDSSCFFFPSICTEHGAMASVKSWGLVVVIHFVQRQPERSRSSTFLPLALLSWDWIHVSPITSAEIFKSWNQRNTNQNGRNKVFYVVYGAWHYFNECLVYKNTLLLIPTIGLLGSDLL